ncbi:MAG: hypothetical protein FWD81_03960, partial [Methanomassiliicoccaceae archaeon]|nr:hypothetical protein [Methanomassiliicoccaceae archaeon]
MKLKFAAVLVAVTLAVAGAAYWYFLADDEYNVTFLEGPEYTVDEMMYTVPAGGTITFTLTVTEPYNPETLVVKANDRLLSGTQTGDREFSFTVSSVGRDQVITVSADPLNAVTFSNMNGFTAVPIYGYVKTGDMFAFLIEPKQGFAVHSGVSYEMDGTTGTLTPIADGSYEITITGDLVLTVTVNFVCGCECAGCIENEICDGCDVGCECVCCLVRDYLAAGDIDGLVTALSGSGLERIKAVPGTHEIYGFVTETYDSTDGLVRDVYGVAVIVEDQYTMIFGFGSEMVITIADSGEVTFDGQADMILDGTFVAETILREGSSFTMDGVTFTAVGGDAEFDLLYEYSMIMDVVLTNDDGALLIEIGVYGTELTDIGDEWNMLTPFFDGEMDIADILSLIRDRPSAAALISGSHKIYGALDEFVNAGGELERQINGIAVLYEPGDGADIPAYTLVFWPSSYVTMTTPGGFPPAVAFFDGDSKVSIIGTLVMEGSFLENGCSIEIDDITFTAVGDVEFDFIYVDGIMSVTVISGMMSVVKDTYDEQFAAGMTWSTADLLFDPNMDPAELLELLKEVLFTRPVADGTDGLHVLYGAVVETFDGSEIVRKIGGVAMLVDPGIPGLYEPYTIIFGPGSYVTMTATVLGPYPVVAFEGDSADLIIIGTLVLNGSSMENGFSFTLDGVTFTAVGDVEFDLIYADGLMSVTVLVGSMSIVKDTYDELFDAVSTWSTADLLFDAGMDPTELLELLKEVLFTRPVADGTDGPHVLYGAVAETFDGSEIVRVISGIAVISDPGIVGLYEPYTIIFGPGSSITMTTTVLGPYPVVAFEGGHADLIIIGTLVLNGSSMEDDTSFTIDGVTFTAVGDVEFDLIYADGLMSVTVLVGTLSIVKDTYDELFDAVSTWSTADLLFDAGMDAAELLELLKDNLVERLAAAGTDGFHVLYGAVKETFDGSEIVRVISGIAILSDPGIPGLYDAYTIIFGPGSSITMTTTVLGPYPVVVFEGGHADLILIGTLILNGSFLEDDSSFTIDGVTFTAVGDAEFDFIYANGLISVTVISGSILIEKDAYSETFGPGMTWSTADLLFDAGMDLTELVLLLQEKLIERPAAAGTDGFHVLYGAVAETYDGSEIIRVISGIAILSDPGIPGLYSAYTIIFGPGSSITMTTAVLGPYPVMIFENGHADLMIIGTLMLDGATLEDDSSFAAAGATVSADIGGAVFDFLFDDGIIQYITVISGTMFVEVDGVVTTLYAGDTWGVADLADLYIAGNLPAGVPLNDTLIAAILAKPGTEGSIPLVADSGVFGHIHEEFDGANEIVRT